MTEVSISALYVYPVKSLRGIALREAILTGKGLRHDRRWMVVRGNGRFVTQRDLPGLARIGTRLLAHGVELTAAQAGAFELSFDAPAGTPVRTRVWQDDCEATDVGDAAAQWLTRATGSAEPLRLVAMAPGFRRRLAAEERFGAETTTEFADSAPYLVAGEASLQALNDSLLAAGKEAVPMNRFRPNIVLSGSAAFEEHDRWRLEGEAWTMDLLDPCERCVVTTVDQRTAIRDPDREPLRTLRRINPAPGPRGAPAFGQNARLLSEPGVRIRVGETARLSGTGQTGAP